jgi:hypothetical protein
MSDQTDCYLCGDEAPTHTPGSDYCNYIRLGKALEKLKKAELLLEDLVDEGKWLLNVPTDSGYQKGFSICIKNAEGFLDASRSERERNKKV